MRNVVIAGYARSPFGLANKGELTKVRPDDLIVRVVADLVQTVGINGDDIEDLILGCAFPEGEQGLNMARLIALQAGLPQSVAGTTVYRFESMTRVPMMGFNPMPNPKLHEMLPEAYMSMGVTAENVAVRYQISRDEQEKFAVDSHRKATAARDSGRFQDEIVPIETTDGKVDADGCIRSDTTAEALSELKPAFDENGSVTAGTSSPVTDGAAATLVCSEIYAEAKGLEPLARIKSVSVAGCPPEIMGIGPVAASRKALERAKVDVNDLDVIELNEAFASQSLACIRDLGLDAVKINLDGGAIALGHPLGATGARITGKAAALLKREGGRYALATQCIGGGQGIATVLESL